jgi:hypothetical protein
MALILEVDFKEKCRTNKVPHVEKYQWQCSSCRTVYNYSGDKTDNVRRITLEYGQMKVDICKPCVLEMNEMMIWED